MKPRCKNGGTKAEPCYNSMCGPCGDVRHARFLKQVEKERQEVVRRAGPVEGDGWITLDVDAGERRAWNDGKGAYETIKTPARQVRVPKLAFYKWALERTSGRHLVAYEPVARGGYRLQLDSAAHTDWLLGAGVKPGDPEWDEPFGKWPLLEAAHAKMWDLQETLLEFKVAVLHDAGRLSHAIVVHPEPDESVERARAAFEAERTKKNADRKRLKLPKDKDHVRVVAVLPVGSPEYTPAILSADAIIVETENSAAHVMRLARGEKGRKPITVMAQPDARKLYPPGTTVSLWPESGEVHIAQGVSDEGGHLYYFGRLPKEDTA